MLASKSTPTPTAGGLAAERELFELCDAIHERALPRVAAARAALLSALDGSELQLVDCAATVSLFNAIDRVADAAGVFVAGNDNDAAKLLKRSMFADSHLLASSSSPITQGRVPVAAAARSKH